MSCRDVRMRDWKSPELVTGENLRQMSEESCTMIQCL